jgi:hypothetical protein
VAARQHQVGSIRQCAANGYGRVVAHQHILAGGQLLEPAKVVRQMPGQLTFTANGKVFVERGDHRNSHGKSLKNMIG